MTVISVKSVIQNVVSAMKIVESVTVIAGSTPWGVTGLTRTDNLFVGQRLKFVGTGPNLTAYVEVASIVSDTEISISSDTNLTPNTKANNPGTLTPVINFHHGHIMELSQTFQEWTRKGSVKREQFPAVCLIAPYTERRGLPGYECEVKSRVVILTDSRPEYKADDRDTNTFEPILIPLYEKLLQKMKDSHQIADLSPEHDFVRRYYWAKSGAYGNTAPIFNDFIDGIDLNFTFKILKTC